MLFRSPYLWKLISVFKQFGEKWYYPHIISSWWPCYGQQHINQFILSLYRCSCSLLCTWFALSLCADAHSIYSERWQSSHNQGIWSHLLSFYVFFSCATCSHRAEVAFLMNKFVYFIADLLTANRSSRGLFLIQSYASQVRLAPCGVISLLAILSFNHL